MPDAPAEATTLARVGHVFEQWQKDFALWLVTGKRKSRADQLAKLFDLTGETWTADRLLTLTSAGLFHEYVQVLRERGLRAAKLRIGEVAYDAVEGLAEGIKHTRAEKDYGTMAKLTGQVLERTMPRRDDLNTQRLSININLSEKQQAQLSAAPVDVEFEVLE